MATTTITVNSPTPITFEHIATLPITQTTAVVSMFKNATSVNLNGATGILVDTTNNKAYYNTYAFAFANCTALTTITLPENLETIKSGTFYNCSSLVNLEIPYTVTSIEVRAFYKCSNLLYVTLGKKIEYIASSAFQLCQKLEEIYYEGKVSDWKAIDGYRYITKVSIVCYDNTFYLSN